MMTAIERHAAILFDYAQGKPDGFTAPAAMRDLGWSLGTFKDALRALRLTLATDEINLTADRPDGPGPWTYRLVGRDEDMQGWRENRLRDAESRLVTIESLAHSLVNATDGRTNDGRKARMILSTVGYLRDQLATLNA